LLSTIVIRQRAFQAGDCEEDDQGYRAFPQGRKVVVPRAKWCRQAGRLAGRQAGRQADRQTDRQTDRQADRQTDRQTSGQKGGLPNTQRDQHELLPCLLIHKELDISYCAFRGLVRDINNVRAGVLSSHSSTHAFQSRYSSHTLCGRTWCVGTVPVTYMVPVLPCRHWYVTRLTMRQILCPGIVPVMLVS
jgi:hypothetical protein